MDAKMMNEIISKLDPTTIFLNIGAIGISLTGLETSLKILVYIVTVLYTIIKMVKEITEWRKKK